MDQLGGPGGVGVGVTGNAQALRPGLCDERQHFRDRAAPVPAADGFQVADLYRRLQRSGHLQHLPQGVYHAVPLLAHMDGDDLSAAAQGFQGADQLRGGVKAVRGVAQPQGDSQCAIRQGALQSAVERPVLPVRQRTVLEARNAGPQGAHACQHPGVQGQRRPVCLGAIIRQRGERRLAAARDGG